MLWHRIPIILAGVIPRVFMVLVACLIYSTESTSRRHVLFVFLFFPKVSSERGLGAREDNERFAFA